MRGSIIFGGTAMSPGGVMVYTRIASVILGYAGMHGLALWAECWTRIGLDPLNMLGPFRRTADAPSLLGHSCV